MQDDKHSYPELKTRELTEGEKAQIRARLDRGDTNIYQLAEEFNCSSSQVAGIKAALRR